jgi:hypothetical protein
MRPGDAGAATGAKPFIQVCLSKIPKQIPASRIRFRCDSGFFSKRIVDFLDEKGYGYVIVAVERRPLLERAQSCRFARMANGWEIASFRYTPKTWGKEHRFIVVRRLIPEDPVEAKQLRLFKDQKYAYHIFVSNLKLTPWRIYLFYSPRARIEKHIRELAYDYPLTHVPTQDWLPNVAFFHLLLLAFDIVHYFKRLCLTKSYHYKTLKTIRMELLVLPGQLVRTKKQFRLKLPRDYHFQSEFEHAATKIEKLKLPERTFLSVTGRKAPSRSS